MSYCLTEYKFPEAKKFFGVPAWDAEVERMFNISGHIFNPKHRSLGVDNYENLVFLKLNEQFLWFNYDIILT